MRLALPSLFATLAVAVSPVAAGDITLPDGFKLESKPAPGQLPTVLSDGDFVFATGAFGADQLLRLGPDGIAQVAAIGFGSIAGIAQSPATGRLVVGDSFHSVSLWVLEDLDDDGLFLSGGEMSAVPATLPLFTNGFPPLPFDLAFRPGTDELYMSGSTDFFLGPTVGGLLRITDATGPAASATSWLDGMAGFPAQMVWDGDVLYLGEALGGASRVIALHDGNADGDVDEAGEVSDYATGLSGASGLVRAADGSLWVAGQTDPIDFSGGIHRLLPDRNDDGAPDGIEEFAIDGFDFAGGLTLIEGPGGFVPGAAGDGVLYVGEFSYPGFREIRSAPRAALTVAGEVANNASFDVVVSGAAGAQALFAMSLDRDGITVPGLGDLSLGFGAPHLTLGPLPMPGGESVTTYTLHGLQNAVGLQFDIQAFTLEAGDVGISNALTFEIGG